MTPREPTDEEREHMRDWLDRKPPSWTAGGMYWPKWRDWYADGTYLGERSARTGPDDVGASQPCRCEVCAVTTPEPTPAQRCQPIGQTSNALAECEHEPK